MKPFNTKQFSSKQRIQKVLAAAGVASRRSIEEMVRQGRISVNGQVQTSLPVMIDVDKDRVAIDDDPVQLGRPRRGRGGSNNRGADSGGSASEVHLAGAADERLYILLNKPKGVYSTNAAQGEQTRAIDLLPPGLNVRVYPVGRLDAQSKGLLLLTNDGELTNQLTHPRYGVPKTYRAVVDGLVEAEALKTLQGGVWLADPKQGTGYKTGKCQIKVNKRARDKTVLDITLLEGRNTEIRRMLAKVGHKVRDLTRTHLGPLTLEGLNPGDSRLLSPGEVRRLRKWAGERGEKAVVGGKSGKGEEGTKARRHEGTKGKTIPTEE
jgi:pseudouridine synthase